MMIRLGGFPPYKAKQTWVKMGKWRSVRRPCVRFTLHNRWFRKQELLFLDDYTQRTLELPFGR